MRRIPTASIALILSSVLAGCSCGSSSDSDVTNDAASDPQDSSPPLKIASSLWERAVAGGQSLESFVALESGVVVAAKPELVLYDGDGAEARRGPWPADTFSYLGLGAAQVSPARFALVMIDNAGNLAVREYDSALQEVHNVPLPAGPIQVSVTADGGRTYVFSLVGGQQLSLQLQTMEDGVIAQTGTLSSDAPYSFSRHASLVTDTGELLVCGHRLDSGENKGVVDVLRVAPNTGVLGTTVLGTDGSVVERSCELVRAGGDVVAVWLDFDENEDLVYLTAALLSQDGGVIGQPSRTQPLPYLHFPNSFVFDGNGLVGLHSGGGNPVLYRIATPALEAEPPCRLATTGPTQLLGFGHGLAFHDGHVYAAFTPTLGGGQREVRIQKLAPLPGR